MLIQPRVRGFICTTAHPVGCYKAVLEQVNYIKKQPSFTGPKNVLVIGASTGYGLASRIAATFGAQAKTIGVFYEKAAGDNRTASPGWYNSAAFETLAHADGYYARSINGDAFSQAIKQRSAELIQQDLQQVDLVIYSLASPRRTHPTTGQLFSSVLKPIGQAFRGKTVDAFRAEVKEVLLEPATVEEIENTVAVMGGEDWKLWIDFLTKEKLLAKGATTVAYSYIGPALTYSIYKNGTIGRAKEHLFATAKELNKQLEALNGQALISVNKALVTQASAAIPVVPLYISLLYKLMKEKGSHEGCIEQAYRLFHDFLYSPAGCAKDSQGQIRLDQLEMEADIQTKVAELWPAINSENVEVLTDLQGYRDDFYKLFGFNMPGVDYSQEVNPDVHIEA